MLKNREAKIHDLNTFSQLVYPGQWAGVNDDNFSIPGRRTGTLRCQPDQDPFGDEYGSWVP